MRQDTLGTFSAIFDKEDSFCDFLVAFVHTKSLQKRKEFACKGSKVFSFKVDLPQNGNETILTELPHPGSTILVPLTYIETHSTYELLWGKITASVTENIVISGYKRPRIYCKRRNVLPALEIIWVPVIFPNLSLSKQEVSHIRNLARANRKFLFIFKWFPHYSHGFFSWLYFYALGPFQAFSKKHISLNSFFFYFYNLEPRKFSTYKSYLLSLVE